MHLLYLDHAGDTKDEMQRHFILAGVSVFERQTYWLAQKLDEIAARFNPADPTAIELHASPMFGGRGFWRRFPIQMRHEAIFDALAILTQSHISNIAFAAVIEKGGPEPVDPVAVAFEQVCSRFDKYLLRLHRSKDTQRGLIVFDKATYESQIQNLATDFRRIGHRWGVIRNLAEVPLFLDSRASRLLQLADLIAYALFRYYERGDDRFMAPITMRLDRIGGATQGLYLHLHSVGVAPVPTDDNEVEN